VGVNEAQKQELQFLKDEVPKIKNYIKDKTNKVKNSKKSTASDKDDDASSSSGSEGAEEVGNLPVMGKPQIKGPAPRMSVSAEVFGKFNVEQAYKPPVHPKSEDQKAAIREKMSKNFMFSCLNPKDKQAVLDAIVPVSYKQGETIIKQGDDGDNFYLVEKGELTCKKFLTPEDKEETFLKTYVPGESFGELALLYNAPRAATIVAKTDCELWSLERMTFNSIIKTAVKKKREKYDEFLSKVEILKLMDPTEKNKIADAFREEWFESGDVIIR